MEANVFRRIWQCKPDILHANPSSFIKIPIFLHFSYLPESSNSDDNSGENTKTFIGILSFLKVKMKLFASLILMLFGGGIFWWSWIDLKNNSRTDGGWRWIWGVFWISLAFYVIGVFIFFDWLDWLAPL